MDECDSDSVTILFDMCEDLFEDEDAEEILYVLGMVIVRKFVNKGRTVDDVLRELKTFIEIEAKAQ